MSDTVVLNPFDPDENRQKMFQEAMHVLVSTYTSPTAFSKVLSFPAKNKSYTLAYKGVITTKSKHNNLPETERPRYIVFYEQPLGKGSFGEVQIVSAVFKYPSLKDSDGLDSIIPLKKKFPSDVLIKVSRLRGGYDFYFYLKEQTYGQHFIKMPYVVTSNKYHFMLLMEKIPGIPLSDFIALLHDNPGMITAKSYLKIVLNLLNALHRIHQEQIIHCDVKPANIMIDEAFNIRFIDFGVSRNALKTYQHVTGSCLYMPSDYQPLTTGKSNTIKTDIFGVCLVILELLGQTHRYYLRDTRELMRDNDSIAVNEILLGTHDFSVLEIDALKTMLKNALVVDSQNRWDDLTKLISLCEGLLNHHTRSEVKTCILFSQTNLQDIIRYQQKGVPILLADIVEWYTKKTRLSVDDLTWCSIALYLYHQLKDEADAYFLDAYIDDLFIQTFITHQLPRHAYWQDTGVAEYCQNFIPSQPQVSISDTTRAVNKFCQYFRIISCLIDKNPSCYQILKLALDTSAKSFWFVSTENGCVLDDKVKKCLETLILIQENMEILNDLKDYFNLNEVIYNVYLSLFDNTLITLSLDNQDAKLNAIQPIISQLRITSKSIDELIQLAKKDRKIPAFFDWVETQLPVLFANTNNHKDVDDTVKQLKAFADNMDSYYRVAHKNSTDQKAWDLFIELTQFIFKLHPQTQVFNALNILMNARYLLHESMVSLIRLKKTLLHAGYWDRVCTLVQNEISLYFTNNSQHLSLNQLIATGKTIQLLFDNHQIFSSPLEQHVFNILVEYIISTQANIEMGLYRQLQNKLALIVINGVNPTCIDAVINNCKSGKLQEALRHLDEINIVPASTSTLFNRNTPVGDYSYGGKEGREIDSPLYLEIRYQ